MLRNIILLFVALSLMCLSAINGPASASDPDRLEVSLSDTNPSVDQHFGLNRHAAIIKTEDDLVSHLAAAEWTGSPLDALSDDAKRRFIGDLVFGNGGVASFNSAVLTSELTPTESYSILALFGLQDAVVHMRHKKVETSLDAALNRSCGAGGGGFWGIERAAPGAVGVSAACTEYVVGKCDGVGTCRHRTGYTCHPPSCK